MKKLLGIYIFILFLYSIFSYSFVDVNLSFLKFLYSGLYLTHRIEIGIIYSIFVLFLFLVFFVLQKNIYLIVEYKSSISLLIVVFTFFSYPGALSFDIFNYITTAKVAYFYYENPYIIYPIEFINEPYLEFTRAANKLALYAPLWILLSAIPFYLGLGNFLLTLFSFKIFIAGFYLATVYIMSKMDKTAALTFALNPLVIIETLMSSHNDIVMVFFAILAFYLLKKHSILSQISLICSVLIKYATVFLIPVFILAFNKKIRSEKVYLYAAISMTIIFLLSPLREELYPWYAIWIIGFTSFLHKNKLIQYIVFFSSIGLMLSYIPYIMTGNYFGTTPALKIILTSIPMLLFLIYVFLSRFVRKQVFK